MEVPKDFEPKDNSAVQIVGPFRGNYYRLLVDGCRVRGVDLTRTGEGEYEVVVDGRFALPGRSEAEVKRWGWLMANAMAVAGGYTCHGPNSKRRNPHNTQSRFIDPGTNFPR